MLKSFDDNNGSLTLESALVVPFFLLMLIGLINFINVAMVYVAMDHAVSETSKFIATHSFPLRDAASITSLVVGQVSDGKNKTPSVEEVVSGSLSPEQIAMRYSINALDKRLQEIAQKGVDAVSDAVIKEIVKHKVRDYLPFKNITEDDFRLAEVRVFNKDGKADSRVNGITLNIEDIAIVVVYKVKMPVPFFPLQEITLTNTAVERAWADG